MKSDPTLISHSQAELNLREKAARGVNRDSIAELCGLLRGRSWTTSKELQRLRPQWNERFIRLLARAARPAIVSGPGTPGYCLAEESNDAELEHAGRSQISQGRDMARSGIGYLRLLGLRRAAMQLTQRGTHIS